MINRNPATPFSRVAVAMCQRVDGRTILGPNCVCFISQTGYLMFEVAFLDPLKWKAAEAAQTSLPLVKFRLQPQLLRSSRRVVQAQNPAILGFLRRRLRLRACEALPHEPHPHPPG